MLREQIYCSSCENKLSLHVINFLKLKRINYNYQQLLVFMFNFVKQIRDNLRYHRGPKAPNPPLRVVCQSIEKL